MYQEVKAKICATRHWVDSHPRTGWYVATVVTLNLAITLADKLT